MEFLYLLFTGLMTYLTMFYTFDERPDFVKIGTCSLITITLFMLGFIMFPQLFSEI